MDYLYYTQEVVYRIDVPKDAPRNVSEEELFEWIQENAGYVFDAERQVEVGDIMHFQLEKG